MTEGYDATIEVCNIMSFVLYTQILKQSVLKPASPRITLIYKKGYDAKVEPFSDASKLFRKNTFILKEYANPLVSIIELVAGQVRLRLYEL